MYTQAEKLTQEILVKNIKIFVMKNKNSFSQNEKSFFHSVLKKLRKAKIEHEKKSEKYQKLFLLIIEIFSQKRLDI